MGRSPAQAPWGRKLRNGVVCAATLRCGKGKGHMVKECVGWKLSLLGETLQSSSHEIFDSIFV
jgi:hypothetical protein